MAYTYQTITMPDFGSGIDQQSAENRIKEGYVESALNADPMPEGYIKKREGYQGYAGYLPLRVTKVEYSTAATKNLALFFDTSVSIASIDLATVRSTPVIIHGKTSRASNPSNLGDFKVDAESSKWYPSFSAEIKRTFATGTHTVVIPSSEHGMPGPYLLVEGTESTSETNNSNSPFQINEYIVDTTSGDVTVTYTNSATPFSGYIYLKSYPVLSGNTYVHPGVSVGAGITTTISIPVGTHGLSNFNLLLSMFVDEGTQLRGVVPNACTIGPTGTVEFTVTNNSSSPKLFVAHLTTVEPANIATGTAPAATTITAQLPNLKDDFLFAQCYLELTVGGTLERVLPDFVTVDSLNQIATVSFTNSSPNPANFFIYWDTTRINSNKLTVDAAQIATAFVDTNPQLTLWGLPHSEAYGPNPTAERPGWVTHIDSYKSAGESFLVSGLGGNLFSARNKVEVGTTHLLPLLYPNLRARSSVTKVIGPAFAAPASTRTRGFISFSGSSSNWATASNIVWDQSTGWTRYVLKTPSRLINGSIHTIVSTTTDQEDWLTIQEPGWKVNSGTFKIKEVTAIDADHLAILVENPSRDSSDFDEFDSGAQAGIFSDQLETFVNPCPFIKGDLLTSDLFGLEAGLTVLSSVGATCVVGGATVQTSVPAGLRLVAQRTSHVLPLRLLDETPTVSSLVRGDMLRITGLNRQLRVTSLRPLADEVVALAGDGNTTIISLSVTSTYQLRVGQYISLFQAGDWNGEHVIKEILSPTTLSIESANIGSRSAYLQGNAISVDEALTISDSVTSSTTVDVPYRWIPVEAPTSVSTNVRETYQYHLDGSAYSEQPILRSTMASDNLYLTNGVDAVSKFDGTSIYRAGLPRWQPSLFLTVDPSPSSGGTVTLLPVKTGTVDSVSAPTTRFQVPAGDESQFAQGDVIVHSADGARYTVTKVSATQTGTAHGHIYVDKEITGPASGILTKVALYSYYFRLNAVDANRNVVASAVVGSQDTKVELSTSSQVRMRLVGLPLWDVLDYDHIEVEIYRTKDNGAPPFYRLATVPLSFENGGAYLDYIDTDADEDLRDLDLVNTALKGAEVGTGWSQPLRSKYLTSMQNRLVLANIKGYPEMDIRLIDKGLRITASILSDQSFFFRKDNEDTGTTSNCTTRQRFTFKTSGTVTINPLTDITVGSGTFTITHANSSSVGDWVYLFKDTVGANSLTFTGWWQVSGRTPTTLTFKHVNAVSPVSSDVNRLLTIGKDIPVWLGTDGNYGTTGGNRDVTSSYQQVALKRLSNAINVSQRAVDTSVVTNFEPWLLADAGGDFEFGQLVVRQPKPVDTFTEVVLPSTAVCSIFVNGILRLPGETAGSVARLFSSRLLVSYPNYPEIFDSPTADVDSQSDSAIDVNSADGQEITAVIPFFGESAFGAALQSGVLVVFKTNSIYLVDLAEKAKGNNPVQRIESQGLGCTFPFSVASTRNGILFANESGLFRLSRNQQVEFIGQKVDRLWKEKANRDANLLVTGHHFPLGKQYKLSFPLLNEASNSNVLVYNHTREYQAGVGGYSGAGLGSWTQYDNHPATGWANLGKDAFFATTDGQVFSIRRAGDLTDFRDDASPVSMDILCRAMDFGDGGIRKALQYVLLHFRSIADQTGTKLLSAVDLQESFEEADQFRVDVKETSDGISTVTNQKIVTIRFSIDSRKFMYFQIRVTNDTIDEPVEIAAADFKVAAMTVKGTGQAR